MNHLLCFGFGFTARALAKRLDPSIWKISGTSRSEQGVAEIAALGFDKLPVCMAKTQKSFSDNETKIGRPRNFIITVREFEFAAGRSEERRVGKEC